MKNMFRFILSLFLLMVSIRSYSVTNFTQRWNVTKKHSGVMENHQKYEMSILQRIIGLNGIIYPVADLTYIKLDRSKEDTFDAKDLVAKLRVGYGIDNWKTTKIDQVNYFYGLMNNRSRAIRISVFQDKNFSKVTVANYRLGYKDFTEREILLIQRALSSNFEKVVTMIPFIKEAYADNIDLAGLLDNISGTASGNPAITSVVDSISSTGINSNININTNVSGNVGVNATGAIDSGQFNSILGQSNQLNQNLGNATNMVDQNWSKTNATLDNMNRDINKQVGSLNHNVDRGINMADKNWSETNNMVNKNWSDTNSMADKNWSDTNKQLSRANSVAEKLSDPKHMFLLSGATAAGAVFGASLANLAIDGMQAGVSWIIDQITDRKGKAERWNLFSEARGKWEQTIKGAIDLERAMDQFLGYYDIFKELKAKFPSEQITMETVLRHFSKEALLVGKKKKKYEELFASATSVSCENFYADKIIEQDAVLTSLNDVSRILSNHDKESPDLNIFDERFFCTKMGEMMRHLLDAENALQDYRIYMIDGKAEYADKMLEQQEKLVDKADRYNSKRDSLRSRERNIASDSYDISKDEIEKLAKADCEREGSNIFSLNRCIDEKLAKGNYRERLQKLEHANKRAKQDIDSNYEDTDISRLSVNEQSLNDRMSSYKDWFKELEEQQFCFQNPTDSACKEISKFRYNGVFYVKDKAMNAMNDICKNEDLRLMDVRKAKQKEASGAAREIASSSSGADSLSPSSGKGFFSSLFSGIGNFFKTIADSIGDIFGNIFGGGNSVGEKSMPTEVVYVAPKETSQINIERSESSKKEDNYRSPAFSEVVQSPFEDEEKILEISPRAMARFEEFLLEDETNQEVLAALQKAPISDNVRAAILIEMDKIDIESINEIIEAYKKSSFRSRDGKIRVDLRPLKKSDNLDDWRKFIELYKKAS